MANEDIRDLLEKNKIKYWEVAEKLGISDSTFSRKLRRELSKEEKTKILNIVKF